MRRNAKETKSLSKYDLLKTSWTYQTKEFFRNSNLHGIRYIAEKGRPFHEKFIWFSFLLIGLLVTLVIIFSLWEKFQTSPTITGLDTDFHKWDIPFPSITICPKNPTDINRVTHYIKRKWGNTSEEEFSFYRNFITVVANLSYDNMEKVAQYVDTENIPQTELINILYNVVTRCEDLMYDCIWKGGPYDCCLGFYPVLTEHGFCYTFNSKHFERKFPMLNISTVQKIKYIYETDNDLSLAFNVLDANINPIGVFIHNFNEKIEADSTPHHLWNRRVSKILFSPKETYTAEETRQLSIRQRHCVFPDEIKLITDTIYTFGACMTQCRMMKTRSKCGCIPFFYSEADGFKHCDLKGLSCIANFKYEIRKALDCKCELGCMNTVYEIEKLEDAKVEAKEGDLEVSFVSWPMIRYKRDVLFGWVDLFVAFGGIAGLFLGFSLLSAVETIYYFTLRACCMVYREKTDLQKLHEEYENAVKPEANLDLKPFFSNNKEDSKKETTKETVYHLPYLP